MPLPGRPPPTVLLLLVLGLLVVGGCSTKRTLTISSTPAGADLWVAGEKRGQTPVRIPFVHYGDVEVRVEKPGYETIAAVVHVPTQIDGYPLIDLPFEFTVRNRAFFWHATLEPLTREPTEQEVEGVLQRASTFRERTLREATPEAIRRGSQAPTAPPPPAAPTGAPPVVRTR